MVVISQGVKSQENHMHKGVCRFCTLLSLLRPFPRLLKSFSRGVGMSACGHSADHLLIPHSFFSIGSGPRLLHGERLTLGLLYSVILNASLIYSMQQ
jgi:hypothetical protein